MSYVRRMVRRFLHWSNLTRPGTHDDTRAVIEETRRLNNAGKEAIQRARRQNFIEAEWLRGRQGNG